MNHPSAVTIRLNHAPSEDAAYNEMTSVNVDILLKNNHNKIGSIRAILIDRQRIPESCFYSAFDEHSADLQWVGCALMEPRYGRTQLQSLAEYDNPEFDFLYISRFHVDDEYKTASSSDVASSALCQFLHHPFISGQLQFGSWKVSSVAYVLDSCEAMGSDELQLWNKHKNHCREYKMSQIVGEAISPALKQAHEAECQRWDARLDVLARQDANPFLRNGFFQDPAIARGDNARILVASHGHFRQPLKSHAQAMAVQFCPPKVARAAPEGKDKELFEYIKTTCTGWDYQNPKPNLVPVRQRVETFLRSGASVAGSHSLHAACMNNAYDIVQMLLEFARGDVASVVNGFDSFHCTPLMVAANSAAGRSNKDGIPETRVLDYLLANGADKAIQDEDGLTAYGHFQKQRNEYNVAIQAMMGNPVVAGAMMGNPVVVGIPGALSGASERAVQAKLIPPMGPSPNDLTGGRKDGIMDYSSQDAEADREWGLMHDEDDY